MKIKITFFKKYSKPWVGAILSRDSGGDPLSEYDEDSSDSESDDVEAEESNAVDHV